MTEWNSPELPSASESEKTLEENLGQSVPEAKDKAQAGRGRIEKESVQGRKNISMELSEEQKKMLKGFAELAKEYKPGMIKRVKDNLPKYKKILKEYKDR